VVAYAVAMTRTPVEVADDLYGQLRARLDPAQLIELTAAIAWENYRARFNHALELPAQGFAEGAVCALPEPPAAA
jgi:alkylhydroperoxidase family enzyme